ncbi:MAG: triphosphoribosyl-dephospho-CoA synthase CitG [Erysipelothrix sp.]
MIEIDKLVSCATKALVVEVSLYPKPGLVDPVDSGAHLDMDYITFMESCFALMPGFKIYIETGMNHQGDLKELFNLIRKIGMENESRMFSATENVNTHKGANFMFGIILAAIGYLDNPSLEELQETIKTMTSGLVENELQNLHEFRTHGEKMYQQYGYTGIRGEVESGIPHAFNIGYPILSYEEGSFDTRLKHALLAIMASNDDANMLKRGGYEGLQTGKEWSQKKYINLNQHLSDMNKKFIEDNLSPGGSADLLAVSIFLYYYQKEVIKNNR